MAGHSKWANIKHRKAAQDAKRGKVFTKLIRELTVAAKLGGPVPADNPRLRSAVDKALTANMTRDTIDRAIARGAGGLAVVAADLHLRHAVHSHIDALHRRNIRRCDMNGHDFQRKIVDALQDGPDEGPAAGYDAELTFHGLHLAAGLATTRDDQHLVGADFLHAAGVDHHQSDDREYNKD